MSATEELGTHPAPAGGRPARRVRRGGGRAPVVEDLLALRRRTHLAGGLLLLAAPLLAIALFLPWSHQFDAATLARYGAGPALAGIPRDPTAWQVYSTVDVGLFLLALALVVVALRGGRRACRGLLPFLAVALAFCAHASSVPPTVGANLWDAATRAYVDTGAQSSSGEVMALFALVLATAGALLGSVSDV